MKTTLEAKIEARNAVNSEHNRLLPILQESFAPLVGKKIFKADGRLLEKFKHLAPVGNTSIQIYRDNSNYSLGFTIKACGAEITAQVGNVEGGTLKELIKPQLAPVGYTVAGVLEARRNLELAKEAFCKAEAALYPFGSYDQ